MERGLVPVDTTGLKAFIVMYSREHQKEFFYDGLSTKIVCLWNLFFFLFLGELIVKFYCVLYYDVCPGFV